MKTFLYSLLILASITSASFAQESQCEPSKKVENVTKVSERLGGHVNKLEGDQMKAFEANITKESPGAVESWGPHDYLIWVDQPNVPMTSLGFVQGDCMTDHINVKSEDFHKMLEGN